MPNRIEKFASVTYIPGSPAVPAQPAYCIPETITVYTAGVSRATGTSVSADGAAGRYEGAYNDSYLTWVAPQSDSDYNLGLQADN